MSTTAPNPYERIHRDIKVNACIDALDRKRIGLGWTDADLVGVVQRFGDREWSALAVAAGVGPLSEESRRLVVERLAGRLVSL